MVRCVSTGVMCLCEGGSGRRVSGHWIGLEGVGGGLRGGGRMNDIRDLV